MQGAPCCCASQSERTENAVPLTAQTAVFPDSLLLASRFPFFFALACLDLGTFLNWMQRVAFAFRSWWQQAPRVSHDPDSRFEIPAVDNQLDRDQVRKETSVREALHFWEATLHKSFVTVPTEARAGRAGRNSHPPAQPSNWGHWTLRGGRRSQSGLPNGACDRPTGGFCFTPCAL